MVRVWASLLLASLLAVAVAWWLAVRGTRRAGMSRHRHGPGADAALRRHPAGRARHDSGSLTDLLAGRAAPASERVSGPDDDPEFIRALDRLIHGGGQGAGTV